LSHVLFPLWQIDAQEYAAICAYLSLTPKAGLYDYVTRYLAAAPFRFSRPVGFSRFLAEPPLTRWRIARLDVATKLFLPDHPLRHILNCVIAVHECDGLGFREMDTSPRGWNAAGSITGWMARFVFNVAITMVWLGWQLMSYAPRMPFSASNSLAGKRTLISGVSHGLGRDLMLHCLEHGAEVIGIVRNPESRDTLKAELPANAPVTLLVADLSRPGALVAALANAQISATSIAVAILCAAVKHDGQSVLSLPNLRDTFQVNFFSIAEFADWLTRPPAERDDRRGLLPTTALVLVSSMGRWHGMHFSSGYNASKAALSIWGESLEMELRRHASRRFTVTIVEPGLFASGMTRPTPLTRLLFASRKQVASRIVSGALAGRKAIRPPFAFALITWFACLMGRDFRYRLFARAKPEVDQ
jgi:NAD(P)-dependent dehydrogenase (short-subunit alcohol dehydrogenase family)